MYSGGDPPLWPGPLQSAEEMVGELFKKSEGCLRKVEVSGAAE